MLNAGQESKGMAKPMHLASSAERMYCDGGVSSVEDEQKAQAPPMHLEAVEAGA